MSDRWRVIALARAFAAGEQSLTALVTRGAATIHRPRHMFVPLATRYLAAFDGGTRPRLRDIVRFLLHDRSWTNRRKTSAASSALRRDTTWLVEPSRMQPVTAASGWNVPRIESAAALAEWVGVPLAELEWLSDIKRRRQSVPSSPLHHYHYRLLAKRAGGGGVRVIEAPQARLKAIQRRILHDILEAVPHYCSAAHGFVKGRSIRSFAQPHIGQHIVLRMDLQDFFPRVGGARIQAVFRTLGYPETVADLLGGLCTNAVPRRVFAGSPPMGVSADSLADAQRLYVQPHLPQGAPTSPVLANMCAYRLDCRLTGLADWAGAVYTRYADDLAFSGGPEFARRVQRYATQIAVIVHDEGWNVQHRKTRIMRQGVRQQLAGLVVNVRANVPRSEFDALKATLSNCVQQGPHSQNRDGHQDFRAHLAGRVAWVCSVNPTRGAKLQSLFERISWSNNAD